uniref:Uncharacterized protein n=1 Tax=Bionectria ochroleuca TaxID=29856 RepID=A0A8H7TRR7_BIOOC
MSSSGRDYQLKIPTEDHLTRNSILPLQSSETRLGSSRSLRPMDSREARISLQVVGQIATTFADQPTGEFFSGESSRWQKTFASLFLRLMSSSAFRSFVLPVSYSDKTPQR